MQDGANVAVTPCASGVITTEDPAQRLLHMINPKNLPTIPLDDLVLPSQRHLLLRVPVAYRSSLKSTLQNFVFDHRSFQMTPQDFLLCLKAPLSAPQPAYSPVSLGKQQPLFDSPDGGRAAVAIPHSIRKAIRDLSKERKFIAYGDDMKKGLGKQTPEKRGRDRHQRGGSAAAGREGVRGYSQTHPRKPSHPAFPFSELTITPDSRSGPTRKLGAGLKFLDLSFASSSAATPKHASLHHTSFSPIARVVVPSLKEVMERIIKQRMQMAKE